MAIKFTGDVDLGADIDTLLGHQDSGGTQVLRRFPKQRVTDLAAAAAAPVVETAVAPIRQQLTTLSSSVGSSNKTYETRTQLVSAGLANGSWAQVINDPTDANNGIYRIDSGSPTLIAALSLPALVTRLATLEAGSPGADLKITSYGAGYTLLANGIIYQTVETDKDGKLLSGVPAKGYYDQNLDRRYYENSHVVAMGQSNEAGAGATDYSVQKQPWGSRKFNIGTHTYNINNFPAAPASRSIATFVDLVPDTLAVSGLIGETQANGLCDYLKWSIASTSANGNGTAPPYITFSYVGLPGKQMHELSSLNQETNPSQPVPAQGPGGYWATMLNDVLRAKNFSDLRGETYGVLAFLWGQGFSNNGSFNSVLPSRYGAAIPHPAGAQWYADQLYNVVFTEMNSGIKAITGQTDTIPMFMNPDPGITAVAQLWASDQRADMHLVGPMYQYPSNVNVDIVSGNWGVSPHLAADGHRWRGQKTAQAIKQVVEQRKKWIPLRMLTATADAANTVILVDFLVPFAPLKINLKDMPKQALPTTGGFRSLYGLQVLKVSDGSEQTIVSIKVEGPSRLKITLATAMTAGAAYTVQSAWQTWADQIATIASVRTGPTLVGIGPFVSNPAPPPSLIRSDLPTTELVVTGDITAQIKALTDGGAFNVSALFQSSLPSAICRKVYLDGGNTIFQLRNFEISNGPFNAGQPFTASLFMGFTNICDSDPAQSLYSWNDPQNYTPRTGPFPMMNWLVQDLDIAVGGT